MLAHTKLIEKIQTMDDPKALRALIRNARDRKAADVEEAAFRRLVSIVPGERPGSVAYDFWQMVNAFEFMLSQERGRTTQLGRTRQKIKRVGVVQILEDWALSEKAAPGFDKLLAWGMTELTGEAIVLRHADQFSEEVRHAARKRLTDAGVEVDGLPGVKRGQSALDVVSGQPRDNRKIKATVKSILKEDKPVVPDAALYQMTAAGRE